ncbi:MAG: L-2-amino-thiazoline-4-carboxylic acid hydrolase [Proteobacteria bacterium]|nr:L-2-amino-thiazoline-4-carboxylic acid hydrolase [Pseudomonadota bacterium]
MLKILWALKLSDLKETIIGMRSVLKTLGYPTGLYVICYSSTKQFNEVIRDIGLMPVSELICGCDYKFWKDYHPNIQFSRDKTLLRGDAFCNHTLTWVEI